MLYADLVQAVLDWSARSDIEAYVPSFISMATTLFNNGQDGIPALRCREMENVSTISLSGSAYPLPADYLQYKGVVELASTRRPLTYIAKTASDQSYADQLAGPSNDFTIVGGNIYLFPTSANSIELTYYQKIPDLSDSATSNWLLAKNQTAYLHASLMYAGLFVKDRNMAAEHAAALGTLVSGFTASEFVDTYARARVSPQGQRP